MVADHQYMTGHMSKDLSISFFNTILSGEKFHWSRTDPKQPCPCSTFFICFQGQERTLLGPYGLNGTFHLLGLYLLKSPLQMLCFIFWTKEKVIQIVKVVKSYIIPQNFEKIGCLYQKLRFIVWRTLQRFLK
jgi:hypothetical protein